MLLHAFLRLPSRCASAYDHDRSWRKAHPVDAALWQRQRIPVIVDVGPCRAMNKWPCRSFFWLLRACARSARRMAAWCGEVFDRRWRRSGGHACAAAQRTCCSSAWLGAGGRQLSVLILLARNRCPADSVVSCGMWRLVKRIFIFIRTIMYEDLRRSGR